MDDMIYRQAAIDAIGKDIMGGLNYESILRDMSSAQQWIPCSKWLPIGKGEVIVSCHDDSGDTSYDYTTCGWVTSEGEYWIVDNEINSHVVAWMSLPKPYKRKRQ